MSMSSTIQKYCHRSLDDESRKGLRVWDGLQTRVDLVVDIVVQVTLLVQLALGRHCFVFWEKRYNSLLIQSPKPQLINHEDITVFDIGSGVFYWLLIVVLFVQFGFLILGGWSGGSFGPRPLPQHLIVISGLCRSKIWVAVLIQRPPTMEWWLCTDVFPYHLVLN